MGDLAIKSTEEINKRKMRELVMQESMSELKIYIDRVFCLCTKPENKKVEKKCVKLKYGSCG